MASSAAKGQVSRNGGAWPKRVRVEIRVSPPPVTYGLRTARANRTRGRMDARTRGRPGQIGCFARWRAGGKWYARTRDGRTKGTSGRVVGPGKSRGESEHGQQGRAGEQDLTGTRRWAKTVPGRNAAAGQALCQRRGRAARRSLRQRGCVEKEGTRARGAREQGVHGRAGLQVGGRARGARAAQPTSPATSSAQPQDRVTPDPPWA